MQLTRGQQLTSPLERDLLKGRLQQFKVLQDILRVEHKFDNFNTAITFPQVKYLQEFLQYLMMLINSGDVQLSSKLEMIMARSSIMEKLSKVPLTEEGYVKTVDYDVVDRDNAHA